MQHQANILLILIAKSKESKQITPGKIFECLQAKRPILAVGPTDGGASYILEHTNAGKIFDFEDVQDTGVKHFDAGRHASRALVRWMSHYEMV